MIITILVFIVILSVLVLVHEFGHFITAKKRGVLVEEFALGFPPRLFGFKFGETTYSINLFPIGGFVKMYGEEYHEGGNKALHDRAFVNKKPWEKSLIIVGGIIGNFLLGWVLMSFLFTQGVPTPSNKVLIENVQKNSPAAQAGLKPNDALIQVAKDNHAYVIKNVGDLSKVATQYGDQEISLTVQTDGKTRTVNVVPRKNPPPGEGALGVTITSYTTKKYPWYQAPFYGLKEAANITTAIVVELSKTLFNFATLKKTNVDVTGPIGIAQFTGQAIKFGNNAVLELVALLSLNLAVINILPFPALDGGRLVFVIYEWVTKKQINKKVEQYTNLAGIALLLSLMALITIHDILKLLK
ncbi:site-2 protease family protein [Candidatus Roizmanbacteria bacterium]|nr:site-2 protease family protein [Candidatus Roizmanbacteria bacterium]